MNSGAAIESGDFTRLALGGDLVGVPSLDIAVEGERADASGGAGKLSHSYPDSATPDALIRHLLNPFPFSD